MTIGIFGGSYNPIHIGHAMLASYLAQYTDLDEVWLMVSPQNPLKETMDVSMDKHRLNMARIVTDRTSQLNVSAFEFSMPRPSYTIDTLRALKEHYPKHTFKLIIGADNWVQFSRWRDSDAIIREFGVIVYPRRGFELNTATKPDNVEFALDAPMVEVSSTFIREGLKQGKEMEYFLDHDVLEYIEDHNLYK